MKSPRGMDLSVTGCYKNNTVQIIIEIVFDFIWVCHRRRIGTDDCCMFIARQPLFRNGLNRAYCSVSARLKCQF